MEEIVRINDWNIVNNDYLSNSFKDFYKKILSIGNNNNDYIQNLYNEKIFPTNNTEQNQNND